MSSNAFSSTSAASNASHMPALPNLKKLRNACGMTQAQLAASAGVSQSIVAKIERGRVEPLYSTVQKLLACLRAPTQIPLSQILNKQIVYCTSAQSVSAVLGLFKKRAVSQMPVIDRGRVVGLVTEAGLLSAALDGKTKRVVQVMTDAPPVVAMNTPVSVVAQLLRMNEIVLVAVRGEIVGIVSRLDVLDTLLTV